MKTYQKLRNSVDTFNQHWRDGLLTKLNTKLPQLVEGRCKYKISEVQEKDDGIYIRFFNGLYTRWKKLAPTDEIVFNDRNYKLMWAQQ
tara:strand:- start:2077 stop:2340 length:264 start_codon:yes stop_codon:yes gene_type:complete